MWKKTQFIYELQETHNIRGTGASKLATRPLSNAKGRERLFLCVCVRGGCAEIYNNERFGVEFLHS